jgi:hypothetical protein
MNPRPMETPPPEDKLRSTGGFTILGQTLVFPNTAWGTFSILGLCAAAVAFAYVILHAPKEQLEAVASFILLKVHPDGGKSEKEPDTINYAFWTPSKDTKSVLQQYGDIPSDKDWVAAKDVTDQTLNDFGEALRNTKGVEGYRRAEVWGQGRKVDEKKPTHPIPGWWWTLRARKNFTIQDLSKVYTEHWHNNLPIYVEILDGAGAYK